MTKLVLQNDQFASLTQSIRKGLPNQYIGGVAGSYLINAAFVGLFIYPILQKIIPYGVAAEFLAMFGAAIAQYFRYLIVFTDQLHYSVESTKRMVQLVAFGMTMLSIGEAWHLISSIPTINSNEFWAVFTFCFGIIIAGWLLEINFIKKISEYTDLQKEQLQKANSSNGQIGRQITPPLSPNAIIETENQEEIPFSLNLNGATP